MSKKVAFYLLTEDSLKSRNLLACRLVNKSYEQNLLTYVFTSSEEENSEIDTQLWTFSDISFVPHQIYVKNSTLQNDNDISPILIGNVNPPEDYNQVVLNLSPAVPSFIEQFSHIIEIVINNPEHKNLARERYKQYQKLNFDIVTHNLDKK